MLPNDASRYFAQSSSASRVTAGALGFLTFTQYLDRPERYCEPSRFDTMPSQPSLQACSKRMSPSPSENSFKTIPYVDSVLALPACAYGPQSANVVNLTVQRGQIKSN